jgi:predicted Zn-dependent peptidase
MWENHPRWANRLESGFSKVTPQLIQSTAREYLRPTNRSILLVEPAPAAAPAPATGAKQ